MHELVALGRASEVAIVQKKRRKQNESDRGTRQSKHKPWRHRNASAGGTLRVPGAMLETCRLLWLTTTRHGHGAYPAPQLSTVLLVRAFPAYLDKTRGNAGDCSDSARGQQGVDARPVPIRHPRRRQSERIPTVDEGRFDENSSGREGCCYGLLRSFLAVEVSDRVHRNKAAYFFKHCGMSLRRKRGGLGNHCTIEPVGKNVEGFMKASYYVWPMTITSYRAEGTVIVCLDYSDKIEDAILFVAGVTVGFRVKPGHGAYSWGNARKSID